MVRVITISTGSVTLEAELNDTSTADAVWNTVPYEAQGSVWGDELYFSIPEELDLELENGQDVVEVGDLAYWPVGNAFCDKFFIPKNTPTKVCRYTQSTFSKPVSRSQPS